MWMMVIAVILAQFALALFTLDRLPMAINHLPRRPRTLPWRSRLRGTVVHRCMNPKTVIITKTKQFVSRMLPRALCHGAVTMECPEFSHFWLGLRPAQVQAVMALFVCLSIQLLDVPISLGRPCGAGEAHRQSDWESIGQLIVRGRSVGVGPLDFRRQAPEFGDVIERWNPPQQSFVDAHPKFLSSVGAAGDRQ